MARDPIIVEDKPDGGEAGRGRLVLSISKRLPLIEGIAGGRATVRVQETDVLMRVDYDTPAEREARLAEIVERSRRQGGG